MADQPAQYLQDNIGPVLSRALAEMSVAQPKDGVDFLATWLKVYAEQEEVKIWREREEKLLKEEREKTERIRQVKEAKVKKNAAAKQVLEDMYSNLKTKVEDESTEFQEKVWHDLIEVLLQWLGLEAAYLGALDEDAGEEGPVIQYDYASTGSEDMKEKILKTGQGVTFAALQANEAMPEDEQAKENFLWRPKEELEWIAPPEDAVDPPQPVRPCMKYYPVSVKCVTDVEKIHYFQMTRLGAYLAVPLIYDSYYTEQALEDAKKFESEKQAEEAAREEKKRIRQEAIDKGEEPPPEDESAEPVEEKKMVLTPVPVKKVVCMDTLGKNTFIDESKIPAILELFKAVGLCKSRTEIKHVNAQALQMIDETTRGEEWKEIEEIMRQTKEELQANEDTEVDAVTQAVEAGEELEEKKEVVRTQYIYQQAMQVALKVKDKIMAMRSWVCVNPKVAGVVAASLLMYTAGTKFDKESIYPKRKDKPDWQKMSLLLDDSYFQGVKNTGTEGIINERKGLIQEQKLSYIKSLVTDSAFENMENAKQISPAFAVLFNMIQAACNYRAADVTYRTAKYKKDKAEAEGKGEAIGYLISEQCDDCENPS